MKNNCALKANKTMDAMKDIFFAFLTVQIPLVCKEKYKAKHFFNGHDHKETQRIMGAEEKYRIHHSAICPGKRIKMIFSNVTYPSQ